MKAFKFIVAVGLLLAPNCADEPTFLQLVTTHSTPKTQVVSDEDDSYFVYYTRVCDMELYRKNGLLLTVNLRNPDNLNWPQCDDGYWDLTRNIDGPPSTGGVPMFEISDDEDFGSNVYSSYNKECAIGTLKGCRCLKGVMQMEIPADWNGDYIYLRVKSLDGKVQFTASIDFLKDPVKSVEPTPKDGAGVGFSTLPDANCKERKDSCTRMEVYAFNHYACDGKPCEVYTNNYNIFHLPLCAQDSHKWGAQITVIPASLNSAFIMAMCNKSYEDNKCYQRKYREKGTFRSDFLPMQTVSRELPEEGLKIYVGGKGSISTDLPNTYYISAQLYIISPKPLNTTRIGN